MYYLYLKTHNKTGLKYLGQTKRNPFEYKGSGTYWKSHLKVHGNDVFTHIIGTYDTLNEVKQVGEWLSGLWNIVESSDWANLREETGAGGLIGGWNKGIHHSEEHKRKIKAAMNANHPRGMLGKHHSDEAKRKISRANSISMKGRGPSEETIQKMRKAKSDSSKMGRKKGCIPWNKGLTYTFDELRKAA